MDIACGDFDPAPLKKGDKLSGLLFLSPLYQGGDEGEVGFSLLVRNISYSVVSLPIRDASKHRRLQSE
jgi:hypothetical protein